MRAIPYRLAQLSPLLSQAGINWVKYPLWFSAKNGGQTLNQLLDFGEQLNAEGIELVGLLNDPPDELREQLPSSRPLSAAEIFAAGAKVWFPSLEPVVSQLAGQVRWWQLGDDTDDSLSSAPDFADKLAEVKKELDHAARDINLGVGWDCGNALPSRAAGKKLPLRFAAIFSRQPFSPRELAEYLDTAKDSPQMRWMSLKPLSKSSYSTADRAEDLVKRMIAAKITRRGCRFLPRSFRCRLRLDEQRRHAGRSVFALADRGPGTGRRQVHRRHAASAQ